MNTNKQVVIIVALLAIGFIFFAGNTNTIFKTEEPTPSHNSFLTPPSFSLPSFKILPASDAVVAAEAWRVFENYLEFARAHNLEGIKSLSHQISATCLDSAKEAECFGLMDNVYAIGNTLKAEDFKHIYFDEHQIIMFTDGPIVEILYFTIDVKGAPKVLGLNFCFEEEGKPGSCAGTNLDRNDADGNGWWNSIESLFY